MNMSAGGSAGGSSTGSDFVGKIVGALLTILLALFVIWLIGWIACRACDYATSSHNGAIDYHYTEPGPVMDPARRAEMRALLNEQRQEGG